MSFHFAKQFLQSSPPGISSKSFNSPSNCESNYNCQNQSQKDTSFQPPINLDRLNIFLSDPNIRQLLNDIINHTNGCNITAPILSLQITTLDGTQYPLNEEGIIQIFSKYGKVVNVIMKPQGKAFIVFTDMSHALFAQKSLNSQYLPDIQANIRVEWITQWEYEELFTIRKEDESKLIKKENNLKKLLSEQKSDETQETGGSVFKFQTSIPVKYTCRYEIQIENEKEFQVARKIIGSKGFNMKKIIDLCLKENKIECSKSEIQDIVKLRLRGKGSGYKEGNVQEESKEPLHLCVSSKYPETFQTACKYVEELLNCIYEEFKSFLRKKGFQEIELKIKKMELSPPTSTQSSFVDSLFGGNDRSFQVGSFLNSNPGSFLNGNIAFGNNDPNSNNKPGSFHNAFPQNFGGNDRFDLIAEEMMKMEKNFHKMNVNDEEVKEINNNVKKIKETEEKREERKKKWKENLESYQFEKK